MDYAWNKPETYLVLVPGVSLLIQKIQFANLLPLPSLTKITPQKASEANEKSMKFVKICKWHLRGSMAQILASVMAVHLFAAPIFAAITLTLASLGVLYTVSKAGKQTAVVCEFFPNGKVKNISMESALRIF